MSVTNEDRSVQRRVVVCHCDSPRCNVEYAPDSSQDFGRVAPPMWYFVERGFSYSAKENSERGPWHFHTLKCLLAWVDHKVVPEKVEEVQS